MTGLENELLILQGGARIPAGAAQGKLAQSDSSGNISWVDPSLALGGPNVSPYRVPLVVPELAYYPIQDAAGAGTTADSVGAGTLTNSGGTFGAVGPNGDKAISFATGQDLVGAVPAGVAATVMVAFWVYPITAPTDGNQYFLNIGNTAGGGWGLAWDTGLKWKSANWSGGGVAGATSTVSFATGTWYRVCASATAGVYVNGVQVCTALSAPAAFSTPRINLNGTVNGGTPTNGPSTMAARYAKLVLYASTGVAVMDQWIVASDYQIHKTLAGA